MNLVKNNILIYSICSILLMSFVGCSKGRQAEYSYEDVYYNHSVKKRIYNVEVLDVYKEKGKEDVYLVEFREDNCWIFETELTKTEYLEYIGEGNNRVQSEVYSLYLVVEDKVRKKAKSLFFLLDNKYYIEYYILECVRYSCIGEQDFTKETIQSISEQMLNSVVQDTTPYFADGGHIFCKADYLYINKINSFYNELDDLNRVSSII